jgi:hypothetical protein
MITRINGTSFTFVPDIVPSQHNRCLLEQRIGSCVGTRHPLMHPPTIKSPPPHTNHRSRRLCVQEQLVHLPDIFHLNLGPPCQRRKNRRGREELESVSGTDRRSIASRKAARKRTANRSELRSPSTAKRSTTPSPSFSPSTFARRCTTLPTCSRLYPSVLTIMHLRRQQSAAKPYKYAAETVTGQANLQECRAER